MRAAGSIESPGDPRVYRVGALAYVFAVLAIFFTVVGFVVIIPAILPRPEARAGLIGWFVVLSWFWFNVLRSPYAIQVDGRAAVRFRRLAGSISIPAHQIRSIRGLPFRTGGIVSHDGGRIWLRVLPADTFDLLTDLRRLNPALEIRGL